MKNPFVVGEREIIVRKDATTDSSYGTYPEKRSTEELLKGGCVNIDKPKGPTSHQVSDYVQRILGLTKAGHSGTLDPGVTGCLPVAYGKSTRVIQFLLKAGKEYVCVVHFHKPLSEGIMREAIEGYKGTISQLPPVKSAVKRRLRERNIYSVEILDMEKQDVLVKIQCQAGTYIRKWVHDLGELVGVGAHMAELRRTRSGPFDESTLVYLQDLADAMHFYKEGDEKPLREILQPVENAVTHLPKVWVFDSCVDSLCHGATLSVPGISKLNEFDKDQHVAVMTLKNELIGAGTARMVSSKMMGDSGVAVKLDKVLMEPGTYPRVKQ